MGQKREVCISEKHSHRTRLCAVPSPAVGGSPPAAHGGPQIRERPVLSEAAANSGFLLCLQVESLGGLQPPAPVLRILWPAGETQSLSVRAFGNLIVKYKHYYKVDDTNLQLSKLH